MNKDESSSLLQAHLAENNTQMDDSNPDLSCPNARKCKVYKRRRYILFVFTLTSIVSNLMWNTWGPIQRPCRVVFGWETWTVLLLSSFGSIGPILGFIPSTWLMDTKGTSCLASYSFKVLRDFEVNRFFEFAYVAVHSKHTNKNRRIINNFKQNHPYHFVS